jgi:uncharacterized protein with NRDE domain
MRKSLNVTALIFVVSALGISQCREPARQASCVASRTSAIKKAAAENVGFSLNLSFGYAKQAMVLAEPSASSQTPAGLMQASAGAHELSWLRSSVQRTSMREYLNRKTPSGLVKVRRSVWADAKETPQKQTAIKIRQTILAIILNRLRKGTTTVNRRFTPVIRYW